MPRVGRFLGPGRLLLAFLFILLVAGIVRVATHGWRADGSPEAAAPSESIVAAAPAPTNAISPSAATAAAVPTPVPITPADTPSPTPAAASTVAPPPTPTARPSPKPSPTPTSIPATATPTPTPTATQTPTPLAVGEVVVARSVDRDQRAVEATNVFRVGETAYVSVEFLDVQSGSNLGIAWSRNGEEFSTYDTGPLSGFPRAYLAFFNDLRAAGAYTADILVNGSVVARASFIAEE